MNLSSCRSYFKPKSLNYSIRNDSYVFREVRINLLTNKLAYHHKLVFACKKSHVCTKRRFILNMTLYLRIESSEISFESGFERILLFPKGHVCLAGNRRGYSVQSVPTLLFFRFVKSTSSSFEWSKPHVSMLSTSRCATKTRRCFMRKAFALSATRTYLVTCISYTRY